MPYVGERASKTSHLDIAKNPDVSSFLARCSYLQEPSPEECAAIGSTFIAPAPHGDAELPRHVVAVDGSRHESSISDFLPSTRVGYIKVTSVLIDMTEYSSLRTNDKGYVDPFRVAALARGTEPLTFTLPSSNIKVGGRESVFDSFRSELDAQLLDDRTRWDVSDYRSSARSTLFHLASLRSGKLGTGDASRLLLHQCASCGHADVEVQDVPDPQYCPACGREVFPSDVLRIWEEVNEYQSNVEPLTRVMNVVEQLMPVHYLRYVAARSVTSLANTAFFIDGPLAVFGNAAWLHASILKYVHSINDRLKATGQPRLLMIGLQKSGQLVDYLNMVRRFVPPSRLLLVTDEFRYRYISPGSAPSGNGFGAETYYGQDFLFKTPSGRAFVFALCYPFATKSMANFHEAKTDAALYPELGRALRLLTHLECDLFEDAIVPIALAHRYTALSLRPGGRVLDLITRRGLAP